MFIKPDSPSFVVIDVETTGLSPHRGDRIIEVGALALEGPATIGKFPTRVGMNRLHWTIDFNRAEFSESDLNLFWDALCNMFEHDRSAACGFLPSAPAS